MTIYMGICILLRQNYFLKYCGPEKGLLVPPMRWFTWSWPVPSPTYFANSPSYSRAADWISRLVMVDFLQWANLEASTAMRSKMSLTKLFMMLIAFELIPVPGWTCFITKFRLRFFFSSLFETSFCALPAFLAALPALGGQPSHLTGGGHYRLLGRLPSPVGARKLGVDWLKAWRHVTAPLERRGSTPRHGPTARMRGRPASRWLWLRAPH